MSPWECVGRSDVRPQDEPESPEAVWKGYSKAVKGLALPADDAAAAPICSQSEAAAATPLAGELADSVRCVTELERRSGAARCDARREEAGWQEHRGQLCRLLDVSARLMRWLEAYRRADLDGGFARFMDELTRAMRQHDCKFRSQPAEQRALFRQNRKTIARCVLNGGWRAVADVNSELGSVTPLVSEAQAVTPEAVRQVEKAVEEYAKGLDEKVEFLVWRLEETDDYLNSLESHLRDLESHNQDMRDIVDPPKDCEYLNEVERMSKASIADLTAELQTLKDKSLKLKAMVEKKCECAKPRR